MTIKLFEMTDDQTRKALGKLANGIAKRKRDAEAKRSKRAALKAEKEAKALWLKTVGSVGGKLIKPLKTPKLPDLDLRLIHG